MIRIIEYLNSKKVKNWNIIDYMRNDNREVIVWDVDDFIDTMNEVKDCVSKRRKEQ